jgi:hypothetical protein
MQNDIVLKWAKGGMAVLSLHGSFSIPTPPALYLGVNVILTKSRAS